MKDVVKDQRRSKKNGHKLAVTETAKTDTFSAARQSFSMKQHTGWRCQSMRALDYLAPTKQD